MIPIRAALAALLIGLPTLAFAAGGEGGEDSTGPASRLNIVMNLYVGGLGLGSLAGLRRRPRRVVFAEGEEQQVIRAAASFVHQGLGTALLWAFPLYWSIMTTVIPAEGHSSGSAVTDIGNALGLYAHILFGTEIGLWYINSIVTSTGVTVGVLFISANCGYAISQLSFSGRKLLWGMILASFMVPIQALIINHFFLMNALHLINTWLGVILPQLIAPIAVIVYKQYFDTVPLALREAARIDGASEAQIFLRVYLPLNWGISSALAIIIFIGAWNAFLWPFLAVTKPELMNVTVAATEVQDRYGISGLAAALLSGLPVAVVYLLFQRRVTEAVMLAGSIKG